MKNKKKVNNNKLRYKIFFLGLIFILIISLIGISFSYWRFESKQNDQNIASSKCFKVIITNESDAITLTNMHPITDDEGLKSSSYSFTIENTCDTYAMYQVNLEDILDDTITKRLNNKYIKISLNNGTPKALNTYQSVTPTINNADASFKLTSGSLAPKGSNNDSVNYNLKLWMNYDTPAIDETMSATFKSKISVVSVYTEEENLNNEITINYTSKDIEYSKDSQTIEIVGESKEKDIIEYSEDGSSYTSVDTPSKKVTLLRTYNKENTPHIYFKDEVGNIKEKAIELQYLDQTGPEIKGIASETWGSVVPISINIKDNKSGLKEYQISEKEEIPSTWKSISGNEVDVTEEVTSNGIYYIYAKDVLDNVSNTSVTVVKIDNIGPVVDFSVTTGNGTANIDASNSADNETGIAKYEYSVDNGTYYSSVTSSYNFTGLSHGSHIFNVRITDNAGNVNVLQKSASVSHVYTVTVHHMYYYHNSEWKETSSSSSKVIYNEKYTPTNITAPTGYYAGNDFEYLDANGKSLGTGTVGTNSVVVTQNIVINVHYYPNKYTVIYNANGGSGAPASQTKYYDTTLTLSSTVPTRSGYTFIGWGTSNSATSAAYGASSSYTGNANLTLYAIFRKTLTVTYKDGGGTQSNYVYVYNAQTSANITLLTERQYSDNCGGSDWNHIYDKLGWSTGTSPNGSVNYSNGQTISISSNLTLYGQYRKQIKIVYDGNGGTCSREYSSNIEYTYYNGSGNSSGGVPLYADLDLSCTRSGYSFNKKIYCNGDRTGLKMIGGTWNIGSGFNCGVICYAGWD